jgi:hopanoid-associated phosphorylase
MIVVVTGLAREARMVRAPGVRAVCGGRDLAKRIEQEIASRTTHAVVSFGLAGALAPDLQPGHLIVASTVVADGERYDCEPDRRAKMLKTLELTPGRRILAASNRMVTSVTAKAALFNRERADAVDMESGIAAQAARRHGLPLIVLRAISDAADRELPPAVLSGMTPDGGMDLGGVLGALARKPGQLPELIRTAREAERGFKALDHARRLLGPGLGSLDLRQLLLDVG